MRKPDAVTEIFLQPGEFHFGDALTRVRTILGSCVSITLWHPRLRIGGMCHFMLAQRSPGRAAATLDGRYAEEAMELFRRELRQSGTRPAQYDVKLFGGGDMFPGAHKAPAGIPIARKNVEIGRALVLRDGFSIKAENLGGNGYRQIVFDIWSGNVWVRHVDMDKDGKRSRRGSRTSVGVAKGAGA